MVDATRSSSQSVSYESNFVFIPRANRNSLQSSKSDFSEYSEYESPDLLPKEADYRIPTVCKVFLGVVFTEVLILVVACSVVLVENTHAKNQFEVGMYALLGIFCSICFAYFAVDGVLNENQFQLWAFVFSSSLINVYLFFHALNPGSLRDTSFQVYAPFLLTICSVYFVLYLVFAFLVQRSFGWSQYRAVGTDLNLGVMYQNYQIFLSLLKVDLMMSLVFLFMCSSLITPSMQDLAERIVNLIGFLMSGLVAYLAYRWVRAESPYAWLVVAYLLVSIAYPVVKVRWILTGVDPTTSGVNQFLVLGSIQVLCRLFFVVWLSAAYAILNAV
eukprot:gnl/Spiro4/21414_TR10477_c0_g1_i1.p1 gnl/Spiro4/21414_TR10477_c0_g1~~gnl/Spiro4/21414_TR10477_c0_g1_i1.p1  ORF type:complete len:330 (-),score=66.64 gnl/Spiro4/21414_TR10477_c0_g1_i1:167-1156(-)